jgi:hypothetical protein
MADEGGFAGAQMEGESMEINSPREFQSWAEAVVTLGMLAFASYFAIKDLRRKNRPSLRIVPGPRN